ncbi:MAG: hypothetical protein CMJ29_01140 [Phycisphaerae bacterium]|nr:hypothetical protein [Phycisphaerae bacterium]
MGCLKAVHGPQVLGLQGRGDPAQFDSRSTILTIRDNCRAPGMWSFWMAKLPSADSGDSGTYGTSLSFLLLVRGPAAFMNL